MSLADALAKRGLTLPAIPEPRGTFLPWSRLGNQLFLAGQICERDGKVLYPGKVGAEFDLDTGKLAAQACALNLLAALNDAVEGDMSRVVRCVRMNGFVNVAPGFHDVPLVINGASELFIDLFGDASRHARTAIGVATLPGNAAVEVESIFEIR
ncbi:Enamine deaminase RidA, house cleaning of reactive enamine intermediates, YjgF/YER057c/UK114 family [Franzmannia pantelleriensis]|uniref:Enamine deaminase RidA, house cleaning of reactive enamine intermediates, YjgF/YER057c/UK114 family n=1 Tax=Franzmannia pantelleriensis TaxID=48727 RepID=A0A1G9EG36_9GAMM|nr:RidA family protein [Halomonas pantelleriensis]SDK74995.1 Enamine deaminase RidA, house cleaning of reactive enamine intermediates, YjgF/YER057c/UK114 family [Halomonas pantelleriensis]